MGSITELYELNEECAGLQSYVLWFGDIDYGQVRVCSQERKLHLPKELDTLEKKHRHL